MLCVGPRHSGIFEGWPLWLCTHDIFDYFRGAVNIAFNETKFFAGFRCLVQK